MRFSPSIFTYAQPLATVRFSQSIADWSANEASESVGTGMPANGTPAPMGSEQANGQDTGGGCHESDSYHHNRNQGAPFHTHRTIEKTEPEMPETFTNLNKERRTRFT
jgi:hypothetical protein